MKKTGIVIIGGGAAGLAAGLEACCGPFETLLLEKNNICGKKLLLTGGGRCNFSHAGTTRELVSAFHGQGKFLFSALSQFDSTHYIDFLSRAGVPVKLESDGRYFPRSDKAVAVRDAFLRALNKASCKPLYNCNVNRISRLSEQNKFAITAQTSQTSETFIADAVILATGAPCYPETGSDGWGLRMAASLGLNVNPSTPALTRIPLKERWPKTLSGVTLSDCELSIKLKDSSKIIETERGELLFTHTGLSGPTALNLSRWCQDDSILVLNSLPKFNSESLFDHLKQASKSSPRSTIGSQLQLDLPFSLVKNLLELAECNPKLQVGQISHVQLRKIARIFTNISLTPLSLGLTDRGMTCRGGIALTDVKSNTMMAKQIPGLFLAGDLLDLDGKTGGYNLQAAYGTGRLAGRSAVEYVASLNT